LNRLVDQSYEVRPFVPGDERKVLSLLTTSLGGGPTGQRTAEFFRWKHVDNPFGPSRMLVAEADEGIIGLRAFMYWRFEGARQTFRAVRAVDTATLPSYRGKGVFSRLTKDALEGLRGSVDLVFNTPNERSLPGYLKMGWVQVGKLPISIRVRRPFGFLKGVRGLHQQDVAGDRPAIHVETARDALGHGEAVSTLLAQAESDPRLHTTRDLAYLRWRYAEAPHLDYRAVRLERGDQLLGLALFRVRPRGRLWETTLAEAIVRAGDRQAAKRLLSLVIGAAPVHHVAAHFGPGSDAAWAMRSRGFVRSPEGKTFVVNPLSQDVPSGVLNLRSWSLSLGDVEVF